MPRRLFIAIDLPKPVSWRLGRLLVQPPRGVRAVKPAQLHLTLHFLGDVEDESRTALHEALVTGGELPVTLAVARRSLELVTALYHAAERRGPVDLPLTVDHPAYHSWLPKG